MAGPKKAAKKKSASAKRAAAPKPAPAPKAGSLLTRSARDPYRGPSATRIERSLEKGTSMSLTDFRTIIKWD